MESITPWKPSSVRYDRWTGRGGGEDEDVGEETSTGLTMAKAFACAFWCFLCGRAPMCSCVGCHRVLQPSKSAWGWTCVCGCENDYFNEFCINLQCRKHRPNDFRVRARHAKTVGTRWRAPVYMLTFRERRTHARNASPCTAARSATR